MEDLTQEEKELYKRAFDVVLGGMRWSPRDMRMIAAEWSLERCGVYRGPRPYEHPVLKRAIDDAVEELEREYQTSEVIF